MQCECDEMLRCVRFTSMYADMVHTDSIDSLTPHNPQKPPMNKSEMEKLPIIGGKKKNLITFEIIYFKLYALHFKLKIYTIVRIFAKKQEKIEERARGERV